jgi:methionyl-tRNA formyltransferase
MEFSRTAKQLYDRWRGFQPWPGAHTMLREKKLIVHRVRVASHASGGEAGVLMVDGDSMMVGCGEGTVLELMEVQMEGKKRMSAAEFLRGYQVRSGERLGL